MQKFHYAMKWVQEKRCDWVHRVHPFLLVVLVVAVGAAAALVVVVFFSLPVVARHLVCQEGSPASAVNSALNASGSWYFVYQGKEAAVQDVVPSEMLLQSVPALLRGYCTWLSSDTFSSYPSQPVDISREKQVKTVLTTTFGEPVNWLVRVILQHFSLCWPSPLLHLAGTHQV